LTIIGIAFFAIVVGSEYPEEIGSAVDAVVSYGLLFVLIVINTISKRGQDMVDLVVNATTG